MSIVDSGEGAPCGHDTLVDEVSWNDDPEGVHQHKVSPVVELLGARVGEVEDVVVEERGSVVQDIAVKLAERDDELGRVAAGVVDGDEVGGEEGTGPPEDLEKSKSAIGFHAGTGQRTAVTVSMHSTKASWVR